ncbi:MAG: GNAT family N-acetyltransferase [Hyphomonadaceae bacterium]
MLDISRDPLFTPRLELRRTRVEDAAAMFEALRHPEMYRYVPHKTPATVADVATRFARVTQETAPDRLDQWLNWTVWRREDGAPLGTVEATVDQHHAVSIGYIFDPRAWGRGYATEAVKAMMDHLRVQGALVFKAEIDIQNDASKAVVARLGFRHVSTEGADEHWRLT